MNKCMPAEKVRDLEMNNFLKAIEIASISSLSDMGLGKVQADTACDEPFKKKLIDIFIRVPVRGDEVSDYIFFFDYKIASQIAATMMGEVGGEFDKGEAVEAVAELANIFSGNAIIWLEENEISTEILPPITLLDYLYDESSSCVKKREFVSLKMAIGVLYVGVKYG